MVGLRASKACALYIAILLFIIGVVVAKSHVVIASCRHRFMSSSLHVVVATLQRVTIHWQWIDSISWHYLTANRQKNEQIYAIKTLTSRMICNGHMSLSSKLEVEWRDKIAKHVSFYSPRLQLSDSVCHNDICNGWPVDKVVAMDWYKYLCVWWWQWKMMRG
jgi:hypothetical protein